MLSIDQIETRLLHLPDQIAAAEQAEWRLAMDVKTAEELLKSREADLLTGNELSGKNAETRKAELHLQTSRERRALVEAEAKLDWQRISTRATQAEFKAYQSLCRIRGAE